MSTVETMQGADRDRAILASVEVWVCAMILLIDSGYKMNTLESYKILFIIRYQFRIEPMNDSIREYMQHWEYSADNLKEPSYTAFEMKSFLDNFDHSDVRVNGVYGCFRQSRRVVFYNLAVTILEKQGRLKHVDEWGIWDESLDLEAVKPVLSNIGVLS